MQIAWNEIPQMKNSPCILLLAISVLLVSCAPAQEGKDQTSAKDDMQSVTIDDEYKMDVPKYMRKATSLNESASLQYQNIFKEAYVIVIDEEKDAYINAYKDLSVYDSARSVIENYTDTQIQSTTSDLDVIDQSEIKTFRIHGLNATSVEIDANLEGVSVPISYFLTFIEGQNKLYFVMAWTLKDKKDKFRSTAEKMAESFRVFKKKDEDGKSPV